MIPEAFLNNTRINCYYLFWHCFINISTNFFADIVIFELFPWHSAILRRLQNDLYIIVGYSALTGPDVEHAVSSSSTMSDESHASYERMRCVLGGSVVSCLTAVAWVTYIIFCFACFRRCLAVSPSFVRRMAMKVCDFAQRFNCEIKHRVLILCDRYHRVSNN